MNAGILCGLSASISWAVCTFLYDKCLSDLSAFSMNFIKQIMASVLLTIMVFFFGDAFVYYGLKSYLLIAASGIIGIGLGDFFWFKSVQTIGPRVTLLMELLTPGICFILSYFIFVTKMGYLAWTGMFICVLGIYITISQDKKEIQAQSYIQDEFTTVRSASLLHNQDTDKQNQIHQEVTFQRSDSILTNQEVNQKNCIKQEAQFNLYGSLRTNDAYANKSKSFINVQTFNEQQILIPKKKSFYQKIQKYFSQVYCFRFGILYVSFQAVGAIITHEIFLINKDVSFLNVTWLRFLASTVFVSYQQYIYNENYQIFFSMTSKDQFYLTSAIIVECIIGQNLQQITLKIIRPDIGQTLLATAPIFGLIISCILGETLKPIVYIGTFVAFGGVYMMIFSQ